MKIRKISYSQLNARQKESYNFHKVAAVLADYGYNSVRLADDWQGADFIAIHIDGESFMKVQLKSRFTVDKKYLGKKIFVAFIENDLIKMYDHDMVCKNLTRGVLLSSSWKNKGFYSWNKTPKKYEDYLNVLNTIN
tara:strand:+ start:198 stop:605 length:408 start_codon:yes stop_codon:yes gene_type:complete